jgi:hypothetical protein
MGGNAVNGFRERIERIQVKIKREQSRLKGDLRSIRYRNPLTAPASNEAAFQEAERLLEEIESLKH